jgi:hypothetical protein
MPPASKAPFIIATSARNPINFVSGHNLQYLDAIMTTENTASSTAPRRFWAVLCNPDRYRFDEDYRTVTESVWMVPRGDVRAGDGLLIWRTQGQKRHPRGVVAIATVLTEPEDFFAPDEFGQYWVDPQEPSAQRRIWVRYERYEGLPLLLDGPHHQLLRQLSVARAQGTGAFQIMEQQWHAVLRIAGNLCLEKHSIGLPADALAGSPEGAKKLSLHWRIERSAELIRRRKHLAMQLHKRLACECCDFDFSEFYGPEGAGFIECHHIRPLHALTEATITTLEDLALVCSNCHRMLHRIPECNLESLRKLIGNQRQQS